MLGGGARVKPRAAPVETTSATRRSRLNAGRGWVLGGWAAA